MPTVTLPYNYRPRNYQIPAWSYMEGPEEGKRAVAVWHRRAGKDLFAINLIGCKAHERIGTYWHLLPTYKQGRNIVWNGFTRDGRKFLDHFPKELVAGENATEMRITFKNQSIYQVVGTDNIDSLVGTNPVGVVFSEYSLQDPGAWDYIRPILAENGGWAMFIYTARGKNHGYKLLEMAKKNPKWFCEVLVAGSGKECTKREDGTPVISDEVIEDERLAGMPEEMIAQEFKCSFEAPLVGSYYGHALMIAEEQNRITKVPYDPLIPVDTFWDIGVADATGIWFVQQYGMELRIIDYYENSGEGLPHYLQVLKDRPYEAYGEHIGPHDLNVREFSGDGRSRIEVARSLGLKFRICPKHEVVDGIEAVRNIIPMCWFDEEKCARGIEGLRGYRKEWDEKNKCYKDHPLHDWTSHPADAFRYFAMSGRIRSRKKNKGQERQETAIDDHQYM